MRKRLLGFESYKPSPARGWRSQYPFAEFLISLQRAWRTGSGTSRATIPLKPKYGLTPISCHAVLERSACAPFIKERRMGCSNATSLRRKSGQMGHPALVAGVAKTRVPVQGVRGHLLRVGFSGSLIARAGCRRLSGCPSQGYSPAADRDSRSQRVQASSRDECPGQRR
jgi:hypothetical protein